MAERIVVLGATGYTGRLVAEALVALGERPALVGRSAERLGELADRLGGLDTQVADTSRPSTVFGVVGDGDVLVSLVGPFARHGEPAVRAALAAGAVYLDSTGEAAFVRRVFEEFGPPARRAGATLLPAMGYDFVPGTLAGALALEEAGPEAVRVEIGYFALGAGPGALSAGTKASGVGILLDPAFAFRAGALRDAPPAAHVRSFTVAGRPRPAVSIGASEHFALPAAYPRLRDVEVHLGWFGPLARPLQLLGGATQLVTRLPGTREALRAAGERLARLTPSPRTPTGDTHSWIAAEASDASGRVLAEVHLRGADPYRFTGAFMARAAQRAARTGLPATGALGAVEAFGLEALEAACREAGIERVAA